MVRARHILVKADKSATEEDRKKAKEKAESIRKRVAAGEDFEKLAAEYSDDNSSKTKGGDLGFFPKGRMGADFDKVAFSLKSGELSPVFETPYGFHIVKGEEKKESIPEPFDRVKEKVKERVLNDFKKAKVDEFVEGAMKDAGVELNLEPFLPAK
jgi:parvulin-like peptidyl-prolyl isomerase